MYGHAFSFTSHNVFLHMHVDNEHIRAPRNLLRVYAFKCSDSGLMQTEVVGIILWSDCW